MARVERRNGETAAGFSGSASTEESIMPIRENCPLNGRSCGFFVIIEAYASWHEEYPGYSFGADYLMLCGIVGACA
jgi:hypothetical protein